MPGKSRPFLPPVLLFFSSTAMLALGCFLLIMFFERHAGLVRTRWDPLSDPLMGDFMEYPGTYQGLHSKAFFTNEAPGALPGCMFSAVAYPPFAAVILAFLLFLPQPSISFLVIASCWLLTVLAVVIRTLQRFGLSLVAVATFCVILVLVSFPLQRLLHQGNVELFVWIFTAAGTLTYYRKKNEAAAILWGLAAAMKLYPIVLLALFWAQRRYRALVLGCSVFFFVSLVSLWWLGPTVGVAWSGTLQNVFGYQQLRNAEWSLRELVANHSVFAFVKLAARIVQVPATKLVWPYYLSGATVFATVLSARLSKMPAANQILAVTAFMLALPTVSYYHTLVHLYAPLLLILFLAIRSEASGMRVRGLRVTLLLLIALLMPYPLFTFPQIFVFCGLVQAMILGVLFLCALEFPFPEPSLQLAQPRTPTEHKPMRKDRLLLFFANRTHRRSPFTPHF